MTYIELSISINPRDPWSDIIMQELANIGFDSFMENDAGFTAYIPEVNYVKDLPEEILKKHTKNARIILLEKVIPSENWNQEWEKNFQPVTIPNKLYIRAEFHPKAVGYEHEIIIQPKMSFGTGHHETTIQVSALMFDIDFKGKTVLDMGCGTGILAILAEKLGAEEITAIDNDEWCTLNTKENIAANTCIKIKVKHGGKEKIGTKPHDVIIANINRNILLNMAPELSKALKKGGNLLLSGFYREDLATLTDCFFKHGINLVSHIEKNKWVAAVFKKN